MARVLGPMALLNPLIPMGLSVALARAFGVSCQTAWRDLQRILGGGEYEFYSNGELQFRIIRACQGADCGRF